jgi:hypothetical protein
MSTGRLRSEWVRCRRTPLWMKLSRDCRRSRIAVKIALITRPWSDGADRRVAERKHLIMKPKRDGADRRASERILLSNGMRSHKWDMRGIETRGSRWDLPSTKADRSLWNGRTSHRPKSGMRPTSTNHRSRKSCTTSRKRSHCSTRSYSHSSRSCATWTWLKTSRS